MKKRDSLQKLTSPEVDQLVRNAPRSSGFGSRRFSSTLDDSIENKSENLFDRMNLAYGLLKQMKPSVEGGDLLWSLWLRTERGTIEEFGDYEDYLEMGEVESREDFEAFWKMEYPDAVQWRRTTILHSREHLYFTLEKDVSFGVCLTSGAFEGADVTDEDMCELISWLLGAITDEAQHFVRDPDAYNRYVEDELSMSKRFGRIRRLDIWNESDEVNRFDQEMGPENMESFRRIVPQLHDTAALDTMTLADFLEYCAICYDANEYRHYSTDSSSTKKYETMADNRHEGLLNLPPDDADAFAQWYRSRPGVGHPWEICRGGNSTHISLQIVKRENDWQLYLAGFSTSRVVETARMAIALFERGVPFVLPMKNEMLEMLSGDDFVGIVPDDIGLGYNHGDFPDKDRVYSFVYLWMLMDVSLGAVKKISWYTIPRLSLIR